MNRAHAATLAISVIVVLTAGCSDATEPPAAPAPTAPPPAAPASSVPAPVARAPIMRAAPGPGATSTPAAPTIEASGALSGVSPSGSDGVVVVPIEESDAVHIAAGQQVRVSFPALPGVDVAGRVVAVAPSPVAVSGVTSYYVTVALTGGDPRLRAGQTAVVTTPAG